MHYENWRFSGENRDLHLLKMGLCDYSRLKPAGNSTSVAKELLVESLVAQLLLRPNEHRQDPKVLFLVTNDCYVCIRLRSIDDKQSLGTVLTLTTSACRVWFSVL